MKKLKFKKLDAFAVSNSEGNPAGLIRLDEDESLSCEQKLKIAKELKNFVSEVAFLKVKEGKNVFLEYYSSEKEVAFCGHATVASLYDLIQTTPYFKSLSDFEFSTNKAKLKVYNKINDLNAVFIMADTPQFKAVSFDNSELAKALSLTEPQISTNLPIEIVNAGLNTLLCPLNTLNDVLKTQPDFNKLKDFCENYDIDGVEIFTTQTHLKENTYRVRVFPPTFGYLEDPATGSGNAALGYYLLKNGLWDKTPLSLEQGKSLENPNIIKLTVQKEGSEQRVLFGGAAQLKIEGTYLLA